MTPKKNRYTVAAYIQTKDCAQLLEECLKHLTWVDEIVISDASRNDDIKNLLRKKHSRAKHFFDRTDSFRVRLKNSIAHIKSDFVLFVCSDEFFTAEGGKEILRALKKPCLFSGFEIPSISYSYGTCFGRGATQLRLFRKEKFYWPMKSIHEMPKVRGKVRVLTSPYHHHNNPILGITAVKHFRYESIHAIEKSSKQLGMEALDSLKPVAFHRSVLKNFLKLSWTFWKVYWPHRHFGFAGLCLAYTHVFRIIAAHVCPTEELRMRKGVIDRDKRGYL